MYEQQSQLSADDRDASGVYRRIFFELCPYKPRTEVEVGKDHDRVGKGIKYKGQYGRGAFDQLAIDLGHGNNGERIYSWLTRQAHLSPGGLAFDDTCSVYASIVLAELVSRYDIGNDLTALTSILWSQPPQERQSNEYEYCAEKQRLTITSHAEMGMCCKTTSGFQLPFFARSTITTVQVMSSNLSQADALYPYKPKYDSYQVSVDKQLSRDDPVAMLWASGPALFQSSANGDLGVPELLRLHWIINAISKLIYSFTQYRRQMHDAQCSEIYEAISDAFRGVANLFCSKGFMRDIALVFELSHDNSVDVHQQQLASKILENMSLLKDRVIPEMCQCYEIVVGNQMWLDMVVNSLASYLGEGFSLATDGSIVSFDGQFFEVLRQLDIPYEEPSNDTSWVELKDALVDQRMDPVNYRHILHCRRLGVINGDEVKIKWSSVYHAQELMVERDSEKSMRPEKMNSLPRCVRFYQQRVGSRRIPVRAVCLPWVHGRPLDSYMSSNQYLNSGEEKSHKLNMLLIFTKVLALYQTQFVDAQHGNILVNDAAADRLRVEAIDSSNSFSHLSAAMVHAFGRRQSPAIPKKEQHYKLCSAVALLRVVAFSLLPQDHKQDIIRQRINAFRSRDAHVNAQGGTINPGLVDLWDAQDLAFFRDFVMYVHSRKLCSDQEWIGCEMLLLSCRLSVLAKHDQDLTFETMREQLWTQFFFAQLIWRAHCLAECKKATLLGQGTQSSRTMAGRRGAELHSSVVSDLTDDNYRALHAMLKKISTQVEGNASILERSAARYELIGNKHCREKSESLNRVAGRMRKFVRVSSAIQQGDERQGVLLSVKAYNAMAPSDEERACIGVRRFWYDSPVLNALFVASFLTVVIGIVWAAIKMGMAKKKGSSCSQTLQRCSITRRSALPANEQPNNQAEMVVAR